MFRSPDHLVSNYGKKFGHQMPFSYQTFYHSNSELLVCYSRHALNNRAFEEQTVLNHFNTQLFCYSDPRCSAFKTEATLVQRKVTKILNLLKVFDPPVLITVTG